MAKTRAIATWIDPAGITREYPYAGRGEPTHCVIDTANDGEFIGWTKDPAQYMRRREADHGEMESLDLVYNDAVALASTPEDTAARDEYGQAGTEAAQPVTITSVTGTTVEDMGTIGGVYGGEIAPDITPETTSWTLYFSRTSTVDLIERMNVTAQYTVTAATEVAKAGFRADLDKMRAEIERRKAAGQVLDVPHIVDSFVPNANTDVPPMPRPFAHANLPDGSVFVQPTPDSVPVVEPAEIVHDGTPVVATPAEPVKKPRKSRAKKEKPVATIDVNAERTVTRDYPQPVNTDPLNDQRIPNHYAHDSLGDPMLCNENHNHPDKVPNDLDIANAAESARAQIAEVATVAATYLSATLNAEQIVMASLSRGEVHRALYLVGAMARFTDPADRMWLAQLAKAVAVDAFDHAATCARLVAEATA